MASLSAVATVSSVRPEGVPHLSPTSSCSSETLKSFMSSQRPALFESVESLIEVDAPERMTAKTSELPNRKRRSSSRSPDRSGSTHSPVAQEHRLPTQGRAKLSQKKRRLNAIVLDSNNATSLPNTSNYVVLATVRIDLQFPETPVSKSDRDIYEPLEFSLQDFARFARDEFSVTISAGPRARLTIVGTSTSADNIEEHMRNALKISSVRIKAGSIGSTRCIVHPPQGSRNCYRLETQIRWNVGASVVDLRSLPAPAHLHWNLLRIYLPVGAVRAPEPWSLQDFYETVHIPELDRKVAPAIHTKLLQCSLYPFQARAVDWALQREGVEFKGMNLEPCQATEKADVVPASFHETIDAKGDRCYVSRTQGMVVRDISSFLPLRGGILAEEMGLGKTVELIALICLHTRKLATGTQVLDHFSGNTVTATGGTLIITPNAILEQWKNELSTHAPHLKVFHYQGLPTASADKPGQAPSVKDLLEYDVVLTTYHVLSREVHYAKPAPERSFRNSKKYEPRRSPLVQLSWWRVCLDEAQMVESGVSQAATVARLLPRCNAWAVSGTPLRKDIQDLRGLLIFLRYEPYSSSTQHWKRVDKATFKEIFGHIAMRHTKDKVRHELRLPPQKRVVITVPFTTIEEQNYSELMQQMCTACGFSPDGDFLDENGNPQNPNVLEKMREWLVRLRQTCLHAEVGIKNRRALGRGNGPLRTVEEVLEVMIEQTDTAVKAGEREVVLAQLEKGHVIANNKSDDHRSENALKVYLAALKQASQFVVENRDLQTKLEKQDSTSMPKGRSVSVGSGDDTDGEERGKHEHGSQHHTHLATIKKSLRSVLELEHACNFFVGTSYYRIKSDEKLTKPESEEFHNLENKETEFYDKAKAIRNELLQDSKESAMRRMKKIEAKSVKNGFARVPQVKELTGFGGIENRKVLDAMDRLSALMNDQAAQIEEWRKKIVEILLKPLVDEDDGKETTGDEYEDSTKVQDELYVNISALRAMVADRHLAVTGLKNDLIDHEMRFTRNQALEGKGHAPELLLKLLESRDKLRPGVKEGSLKGAISSVRALETNLQWQADGGNLRAKNELLIVQDQLAQIQAISSAQTKAVADLEKDLILFGMTMNRRLEYYRQLQHISDTVAPWKEELDEQLDEAALAKQQQREVQAGDNLRRVESKRRYLLTIREGNDKADDQQRICKICTDEIEVGVLTICGHQYCKECIQAWYNARRTCPDCRRRLHKSDFHDITYKPREMKAQEENHQPERQSVASSPRSSSSIYSDISSAVMDEIKSIDLAGSYGTKVDTIARHLLWIREHDPGAKSIIFSQFGDFLDVLRTAFTSWNIGASSIGEKHGIEKFRSDPSTECFLLDAKSDSSGLNVVNATYVFLCEPLINPAIELQAIARVHRIGQLRPTTVFMYLVSDTVEEAIYDISVARRLEHISHGRSHAHHGTSSSTASGSSSGTTTPGLRENAIDAANSLEMEQAPLKQLLRRKGDGEVVGQEDLWKCLFSKPRKQVVGMPRRMRREVERHLRAEAAEGRMEAAAEAMMEGTSDEV